MERQIDRLIGSWFSTPRQPNRRQILNAQSSKSVILQRDQEEDEKKEEAEQEEQEKEREEDGKQTY